MVMMVVLICLKYSAKNVVSKNCTDKKASQIGGEMYTNFDLGTFVLKIK